MSGDLEKRRHELLATPPKTGVGTQISAPGYKMLEWDGHYWEAFEKESNQWYPSEVDYWCLVTLEAYLSNQT